MKRVEGLRISHLLLLSASGNTTGKENSQLLNSLLTLGLGSTRDCTDNALSVVLQKCLNSEYLCYSQQPNKFWIRFISVFLQVYLPLANNHIIHFLPSIMDLHLFDLNARSFHGTYSIWWKHIKCIIYSGLQCLGAVFKYICIKV